MLGSAPFFAGVSWTTVIIREQKSSLRSKKRAISKCSPRTVETRIFSPSFFGHSDFSALGQRECGLYLVGWPKFQSESPDSRAPLFVPDFSSPGTLEASSPGLCRNWREDSQGAFAE